MHNRTLIDAATDEVHEHSDEHDYAKHPAGTERLLLDVHAAAGKGGAPLKEIHAVVDGGNEGEGGFGQGVGFAEEGDDGCLAAVGVFGRLLLVVVVFILVFVLGIFIFVVVVVVVFDDGSGEEIKRGVGRAAGGRRGTEGAAGVVEDELAAAEDRLVVF